MKEIKEKRVNNEIIIGAIIIGVAIIIGSVIINVGLNHLAEWIAVNLQFAGTSK